MRRVDVGACWGNEKLGTGIASAKKESAEYVDEEMAVSGERGDFGGCSCMAN